MADAELEEVLPYPQDRHPTVPDGANAESRSDELASRNSNSNKEHVAAPLVRMVAIRHSRDSEYLMINYAMGQTYTNSCK
jgi:hypothetical protein